MKREDFNADNAKIDAAIKAVDAKADRKADAAALTALQTTVEAKGNCYLVTGSYVGTGKSGQNFPNSLTFTRKPMLIFLATNRYDNYNNAQKYHILSRNLPFLTGDYDGGWNPLTWTEYGVSWYSTQTSYAAECQFNIQGTTYEYIALLI